MKRDAYRLALVSLFAAMISVGAMFSLPLPPPLPPVTLAVFFSLLSGLVLGPLWGLAATGLYLALGCVGLPVFANGAGGIGQFAGPTGGFLLGYAAAAVVSGAIADRRTWGFARAAVGATAGVAMLYAVGLPWFRAVLDARPDQEVSMLAAFLIMSPYLAGDLVKAVAAAALVNVLKPLLRNYLPAGTKKPGVTKRKYRGLSPKKPGSVPEETGVCPRRSLMKIELRGIYKTFSDGTRGLDGANLVVETPSFVVLSGRNGSGKSLLVRHALGLETADEGAVIVDGVELGEILAATRRRVALVFQEPEHQILGVTVREDVEFGPRASGEKPASYGSRVEASLTAAGLAGFRDRLCAGLSGGEKRRLAVASALVAGPELIVLDEPFNGLAWASSS
jgi:energy-coupling factor transporter ATP-binding protein EcfA2/biotin transporter BioY